MKKRAFLLLLIVISLNTTRAGNSLWGWFHITPKIGIGTSNLVNKTMFDHFDVAPRLFNLSYMYGAQLGAAFLDNFDFSAEVSRQGISQLYWVNANGTRYTKNLKVVSNEYGGFFKLMGGTGYFEIGATISMLHHLDIENEITENNGVGEVNFEDNTDYFNKEHYQLAIGFGASVVQVDLLELTFGLRIKYGIQPLAKGPELPLTDNVYTSNVINTGGVNRDLSFILEVDVHNFFGFFGRAICGSRSVVFFQKPKKIW